MSRALCAFVVFILFMAIQPAPAATIEAKGRIIEIKGDIDHGDFDKFSAKLGAAPDAKIVSIASPGGRAQPAYRIGVLLRIWQLGTVVPAGQRCASACVTIWAAGVWRELEPGAELYVHCPYRTPDATSKVKDLKLDLKKMQCDDAAKERLARYFKYLEMPQALIDIVLKSKKPSDKALMRRNMEGLTKPRPIPLPKLRPKTADENVMAVTKSAQ
jgi:hypothetical protein